MVAVIAKLFAFICARPLAFGKATSISNFMKLLTNIALAAALAATPLAADDINVLEQWEADHTLIFDAGQVTLSEFQWIARPLVVFADTPNDPRFRQQMELLERNLEDLAERDVVLITDTDPALPSELRTQLRPRGYVMALLGKDGRVALRKPAPWSVRELSRSIDKMPLRQQEIRDRRVSEQ